MNKNLGRYEPCAIITPVEKFLRNVNKLSKTKLDREGKIIYYRAPRWEDTEFQERRIRMGRLVKALDNPQDRVDEYTIDRLVYASLFCSWNEVDELDLLDDNTGTEKD